MLQQVTKIYDKLGCDMMNGRRVLLHMSSANQNFQLSSINSLHTSIKHRKENATLRTSSQKNVTHERWLSRVLAYLHTRANTHIYYTSYRSPDFFHGPKVSVWNNQHM